MTALVIVVTYLVIGSGAAIAVLVQRRTIGVVEGAPAAVLMLFLWPFLLPTTLLFEPGVPVLGPEIGARTDRARRIDGLARSMREVWAAGSSNADGEARERALLEAFVAKLRAKELRLREMEAAIGGAPESIHAKLRGLRDGAARDVDGGAAILEEIVAQLTLLRFSELAAPDVAGSEREHVEGLLLRIEALADLSVH